MVHAVVLGGSEFMGRTCVLRLLDQIAANRATGASACATLPLWDRLQFLTIVNRGNRYWEDAQSVGNESSRHVDTGGNFATIEIAERGDTTPLFGRADGDVAATLPRWASLHCRERGLGDFAVDHVLADRTEDSYAVALSRMRFGPADVVIDFCAFDADDMRVVMIAMETQALAKKHPVQHYFYISSDSCYEVCQLEARTVGSTRRIVEEEAVRPGDRKTRKLLNRKDSYGHGKLRGEEVLAEAAERFGLLFTALRLPDVFGPWDNLHRFWRYQLWVRAGKAQPVEFTRAMSESRLSFVFSSDVVAALGSMMSLHDHERLERFSGQHVNVCFDETPTLVQFVEQIAAACATDFVSTIVVPDATGEGAVEPSTSTLSSSSTSESSSDSDDGGICSYFPSVNCGPISNAKIRRLLPSWRPTPLATAIQETVKFFDDAWERYPAFRQLVSDDLTIESRGIIEEFYAARKRQSTPQAAEKRK